MLQLQQGGCHNINFVTPTHVIPQILLALKQAVKGGLNVQPEPVMQPTCVNVMSQYYPCGKAYKNKELSRRITSEEYYRALMKTKEQGITRLDNLLFK